MSPLVRSWAPLLPLSFFLPERTTGIQIMSPPRGSQNLEAARSPLTSKKPPFIAPPGLAGSTSHALKAVELERGKKKGKEMGFGGKNSPLSFCPEHHPALSTTSRPAAPAPRQERPRSGFFSPPAAQGTWGGSARCRGSSSLLLPRLLGQGKRSGAPSSRRGGRWRGPPEPFSYTPTL